MSGIELGEFTDGDSGIPGSAVPSMASYIAGTDNSGNLRGISTDSSGNVNLNNISGTVSLPTGAATSALQTTGNTSIASIDTKTPALGQAVMAASRPVVIASNQSTINVNAIPVDGTKTTYSAAVSGLVTAATATDIFTIAGSGTKTIRVTRVEISGTTTSGSGLGVNLLLIKRSAANTGGTSAAATLVPLDSNNAAATASVLSYTANPGALGAAVGNLRAVRYDVPTSGIANATLVWDFGTRPAQAVVLRGTSQLLCVNMNATTITGPIFDLSIEWTEE